jgi:hypothetical protein
MKNMIKYAAILIIWIIFACRSNSIKKNSISLTNNNMALTVTGTNTHTLLSMSFKDLKKFSLTERMGGYPPVTLDDKDIWHGGIQCTGWEKYTKEDSLNKRNFILNQNRKGDHFYFVVTEKIISVYYDDSIRGENIVDSIMLSTLKPVIQGERITGGVNDVGNFKEGYCFELKGIHNSVDYNWIVCSDSYVIN